jgi:polyisoprenoid-binding protein YceI
MKPVTIRVWAMVIIAGTTLASPAFAGSWKSVAADSQLNFIANLEGSEAPGHFNRFDVQMEFDQSALATSAIQVTVDIASATMNSNDLDKSIAESDWFDAASFPQAEFHSDNIRLVHGSEFLAEGTVLIKGVSKPVAIPIYWTQKGKKAEINGAITLSRTDFGIGTGEWEDDSSVGHAVQVSFRVALSPQP